ncbi:hypothetical protein C8R43DRAFT_891954 [Mycena crocata]|nr:hypothetical protein C8R43DRAFT_891954 [Mycena crocata]
MPRDFRTPLPMPVPPVPILRMPDTECDTLAAEAVALARTSEEATKFLYGPVLNHGTHLLVHILGSCRNAGRIDAKAALAVHWGIDNKYNISYRVDGPQNEGRAVLAAVILVLSRASPNRRLELSTTSKYAIRAITYWAGDNYTRGWPCANGDLLRVASSLIRNRPAPVHFLWTKPDVYSSIHNRTRLLATACLDDPNPSVYICPSAPDWIDLDWEMSESEPAKVTASIAAEDPPKARAVVLVTADDLTIGDKPETHRGRKKFVTWPYFCGAYSNDLVAGNASSKAET